MVKHFSSEYTITIRSNDVYIFFVCISKFVGQNATLDLGDWLQNDLEKLDSYIWYQSLRYHTTARCSLKLWASISLLLIFSLLYSKGLQENSGIFLKTQGYEIPILFGSMGVAKVH